MGIVSRPTVTGAEVTGTSPYPAFVPVAVTLSAALTSPAETTYVSFVAPAIGLPSRSHWYEKVTGAGPHVLPVSADSVEEIVASPEIVTVPGVSVPGCTGSEDTETEVVCPSLVPITVTVRGRPRSSAVGVYEGPVAVRRAVPSRVHA